MVPVAGVEPARVISPTDFESASSTNSNTPADIFLYTQTSFPGIWRDMQEGCERQMKNRSRKTLDFPGLFPTPATDGEVVFESTTSTIPSHRRMCQSVYYKSEKNARKIFPGSTACRRSPVKARTSLADRGPSGWAARNHCVTFPESPRNRFPPAHS